MAALALAAVTTPHADAHVTACADRPAPVLCAIHHWRDATHRIQRQVAAHPTRYGWTAERSSSSAAYRAWVRNLWHTRYVHWWHATHPWSPTLLADFMCIHRGEGAWNDPGAPYWGGLQMDVAFMAAYGPRFLRTWGTADHWPPIAQLLAAYRGYQTRGFEPWPVTAARCGLL